MTKTRSQQAVEWRRGTLDPGELPRTQRRAAERFGISQQAVYREELRQATSQACQCCGGSGRVART